MNSQMDEMPEILVKARRGLQPKERRNSPKEYRTTLTSISYFSSKDLFFNEHSINIYK